MNLELFFIQRGANFFFINNLFQNCLFFHPSFVIIIILGKKQKGSFIPTLISKNAFFLLFPKIILFRINCTLLEHRRWNSLRSKGGGGGFDTLFLLNETWARGNVCRRWRYIFPLVFSYKKLKWLKLVRFLRPFSKDYYFTDGLTELRNNNRSILKCSKTLKMFLVPKYHLLHRYKNALFFFSFFSLFFFLLLFSHAKATATKVKLKRATLTSPYYTRIKPIDSMGAT